jgi:hypothetical protein
MLYLVTIHFRQGVAEEDNRAAATLLRDRLLESNPWVNVINAVADLGGGEVHIIADIAEQAMTNIQRILEFRRLSAVERIEYTPVVDAKAALNAYLSLELVPRDI